MLGLQPSPHHLPLGLKFLSFKVGVSARALTPQWEGATRRGWDLLSLSRDPLVWEVVSQCPQLLPASCRRPSPSCGLFWWLKP